MNYDPIDTCPYDPVHRIMRSRMQIHLTKCAKNWPLSKKKQCPYDARHIVNQIEYNYHVSVCPQRESVMRYKIVENTEIAQPKILPIDTTPAAASDENWEDDVKVKSYDPIKSTENRPVIRMLAGAQKAERKSYQKQERLRLSRLEDAPKIERQSTTQNNIHQRAPASVQPIIPIETSTDADLEYKPLRRPKKLPFNSSKLSDLSTMNDSVAANQTQTSVLQNESLQQVQEESNATENSGMQPRKVFSYAAALQRQQISSNRSDYDVVIESASAAKSFPTNQLQQNSSIESDYDVIVESVKFDEKENNSSFFNNTIENLVKVTKTVEELTIGDEGHKKKSESLDKTLESLKKTEKNTSAIGNGVNNSNNNNNSVTSEKRSSRCAANFTNSKYLT